MKKKQEIQKITFNHSSDIDFKDYSQKLSASSYSTLVFDTTLVSDNPLGFRKSLL